MLIGLKSNCCSGRGGWHPGRAFEVMRGKSHIPSRKVCCELRAYTLGSQGCHIAFSSRTEVMMALLSSSPCLILI